jgi:formylglycine-generating enzyme required for sulfatase activity
MLGLGVVAALALTALGGGIYLRWLAAQAAGPAAPLTPGPVHIGASGGPYPDDNPPWTPTVTAFAVERYEVSNRQYRRCVDAFQCAPPNELGRFNDPLAAALPVTGVTAPQAAGYCRFIGRRLPTEIEWERAARGLAAADRPWPWGTETPDARRANLYYEQELGPQEVTSYTLGASPEQVYNLVGNVAEWTASFYTDSYTGYDPAANTWDGQAASLGERTLVVRGGSWLNSPLDFPRVTVRFSMPGGLSDISIGFRCVAVP